VLTSNTNPHFKDSSGALTARFIILASPNTNLGNEDLALGQSLKEELPGIFNWAIEGLRRLERQGRFTLPDAHNLMTAQLAAEAAPLETFASDYCEFSPEFSTGVTTLYHVYEKWCAQQGLKAIYVRTFGRHLYSTFRGRLESAGRQMDTVSGTRCDMVKGVRLTPEGMRLADVFVAGVSSLTRY
jgi:putative DNA primase/helicase